MNNNQNNRTNRDQDQAAQSAAGNRRDDQSGPMTQPGVDVPKQGNETREASSNPRRGDSLPGEKQVERSPSQENL